METKSKISILLYCSALIITTSMATGPIIKKGPIGGHNGSMKDMDPRGITRIVKISIFHSDFIHSLTVYFERNDTMQSTDQWGEGGGKLTEIELKPNEYITSVKGNIYDGEVVSSLVLETNLAIYGPYGGNREEKDEPFEFPALDGKIIGFHAHCENYVHAIGVYVQSTGPITKKGPIGGHHGSVNDMDPRGITRIVKISIRHNTAIVSLTVYFERDGTTQSTEQWGEDGGSLTEIDLKTNEYITSVKGYIGSKRYYRVVVSSLVLETNLAVYGPYGGIPTEKDEPFEFPALGDQIIGFHARCGRYVNAIGVYVQATGPIIKKGPIGHQRGLVKDMDPRGITRIVKIGIIHSDFIDSLTVYFERDGTTQSTDKWGEDGGELTEIELKINEYITSVKGYIYDDVVVSSLVLETNLAVYGPYGGIPREIDEPFEFLALGGQIIGFHACYDLFLYAIGVYVLATGPIIKSGRIGARDGSVKDMDPKGITRIVKIGIRHSNLIDALTVYFERNGTTQCTDRWGGNGGDLTEIELKTYEYITSVRGYITSVKGYIFNGKLKLVKSLVLETNLAVYGPYGGIPIEKDEPFEFPALCGQIIGFHARCGGYVNAIGVYVQAFGPITKTKAFGGLRGSMKDMDTRDITRIVKITIRHSDVINALIVHFERNGTTQCTQRWGGYGGNRHEINFKTNEYIKSVRGYIDNFYDVPTVTSLKLETNLAVYGPYGKEKGAPFELPALQGQIIGFHAIVGKYINAIGVYVLGITSKSVICDDNGESAKDMSTTPIIKKGLIGGHSGSMKDMDPRGINRIVKISIHHSDAIYSLTVYFECNGTTQSTDQWGRDGRSLTEIELKPNEYITYVKGNIYRGSVVSSLALETNLVVYGPYGGIPGEEDEPFEFPALGGQIIGFHARCGWCVNAIGVYVQGPRRKSVLCGGNGGSPQDMDRIGITHIVKVTIHHSDAINALSVNFDCEGTTEVTSLWGGKTGVMAQINLERDDYITSVRGYVGYFRDLFIVRSLEIKTKYHHYGPYGKEEGTPFEHSVRGVKIIGFHGRSGEYLDAIGVYFQVGDATGK